MAAHQHPNTGGIARFGVFELDLAAGELRKNGVKLRLQEQPFQVLSVLIERAGEVVTREEIRQKLWADDTFVDFDHGLNTAVNKLREVLGDSAASPLFVETLARRGYRFIAPVQTGPRRNIEPDTQASHDPAHDAAGRNRGQHFNSPAPALHPELDVPIPNRAVTRSLFAVVQIMYLSFYVSALFRIHTIHNIADSFLPAKGALALVVAVLVTAGVGIPLRCYLISAAAFDYRGLGFKFRQMFPLILILDQLWGIAPFLLTPTIGLGAAFAATAALLYVPFGERTLVRLAYSGSSRPK